MLIDNVDVIFIIIISLDSDKVSMYGYMVESIIVMLNGIIYIFIWLKLVVEVSGVDKSVVDINEIWVLFDWNGVDNYCNILLDVE